MLVYKYRSGTENDLKALKYNQFWSSSIEQLNDPCEAITDTKKIKKFLNYIGKKVGAKTSNDFNLINENTDEVLSMDNKMGIYSLSKTPLDELLWAHYANSHKGFCIEYDTDILLKNDGGDHIHSFPVSYSKKPPSVGFFDLIRNNKSETIKKFAFYKSKKWEYEKEHRIVTSKTGLNSYDHKALKSVYFGLKMGVAEKNNILNLLKGRGVNFYQIELEKNSYLFKATKINVEGSQKIDYLRHVPESITSGEKKDYEILKTKIFNYSGVGEFKVFLKQELNPSELKWLIEYLKEHLFKEGKSLFFNFYTNHKQIDDLPWVSATLLNNQIDIQYNFDK